MLQEDIAANGPTYAQWNIALHDDEAFEILPASHRRPTTPEEKTHLQSPGGTQTPLPGSTPVALRAGDGVVYNNLLLHRGAEYRPERLRRTLHPSYRSYGGQMWPRNNKLQWCVRQRSDLLPCHLTW